MIENTSIKPKLLSIELSKPRTNSLTKFISCLIPFVPLVIYYYVPFTTISFDTALIFFVALFVIISLITKNIKPKFGNCKYYLFLVLWTIIVTTIFYVSNFYAVDYGIGLWYIVLAFLVVYGVETKIINGHVLLKAYKTISIIAMLFLILQWIIFFLTGQKVSFLFLFLPFNDSYPLGTEFIRTNDPSFNFASFFSERSHFCLYVTPLLCISFIDAIKKKRRIILPIVLFACILSTTSGNGIVVSALALFFSLLFSTKGRKRLFYIFLSFLIISVAFLLLNKIPEFNNIFDTLFRGKNEFSHSKSDYRIYRGIDYFIQLPTFNKLFGIGYRCLSSSFDYYGLVEHYNTSGEYMGCLTQILIYSGVFGILLFSIFIVKLFFKSNAISKTILFCFLAYCLSSSIYYDSIWILYLTIILSINQFCIKGKERGKYGTL